MYTKVEGQKVKESTGRMIFHRAGAEKWLNASAYVSIIRRLVVRPSFFLLALTCYLRVTNLLPPVPPTTFHVYVIMHVKDP